MISTRSLRILSASAIGLGLCAWFFPPEQRSSLLPRIVAKTLICDRFSGGLSSVVLEPSSEGIRFRYTLTPPVEHPWAGVNLSFSDSLHPSIDLHRWNQLEIRSRSTPSRPVRIQLLSDDAPPSHRGIRDSLHPIYHALEYVPDGTPTSFPWAAFSIPSWWRSKTNRSDAQRIDLLDRLRAIEFHSGDSPSGRDSAMVELLEIDLVGPHRGVVWAGRILVALAMMGLLASLRKRSAQRDQTPNPVATPLIPEPVTMIDPRARQCQQLVQALRETFADPELSLESFAASQGLPPRLAASLIKEATQLHFKGALNELRLTEAARLLLESRASISEIAYAVGFQNLSHFGRAFRERHGASPSDFRASKQPSAD